MAFSDATKTSYSSAIQQFIKFGGYCPCKPSLLVRYINERGSLDREDRLRAGSLKQHISAISKWHISGGYKSPTGDERIGDALRKLESLERQNNIQSGESRYLTAEEGVRVVSYLLTLCKTMKEKRDRLLVGLAFVAGHRAGMLARIKIEQLMNLKIAHSDIVIDTPEFKTKGKDPTVIPYTGYRYCPATWIRQFIDEQNLTEGYLFKATRRDTGKPLSSQTINKICKDIFKSSGVEMGRLTSHSFRKMMATHAAMNGVSVKEIASQGGWKNTATLERDYISAAIGLAGNAPRAVIHSMLQAEQRLNIPSGGFIENRDDLSISDMQTNINVNIRGQILVVSRQEAERLIKEINDQLIVIHQLDESI